MDDLVERLQSLYVWPQSVADHHADTLTPRQIEKLYEVGNVAEQAAARIQALETSLATVQRAAKTIMIHEADELRQLRDERVKWHQALATLDSERQANALLTDRVEALETSLAEAGKQLRANAETLAQVPAAIAEARRQAFEEAAKVAESGKTGSEHDYKAAWIAHAIRALASDPLLDRQGE